MKRVFSVLMVCLIIVLAVLTLASSAHPRGNEDVIFDHCKRGGCIYGGGYTDKDGVSWSFRNDIYSPVGEFGNHIDGCYSPFFCEKCFNSISTDPPPLAQRCKAGKAYEEVLTIKQGTDAKKKNIPEVKACVKYLMKSANGYSARGELGCWQYCQWMFDKSKERNEDETRRIISK